MQPWKLRRRCGLLGLNGGNHANATLLSISGTAESATPTFTRQWNEWSDYQEECIFPMVPGHEIAGIVSAVGGKVTKYKVGDKVGVGCFVDSCGTCPECRHGVEQYCSVATIWTYNG